MNRRLLVLVLLALPILAVSLAPARADVDSASLAAQDGGPPASVEDGTQPEPEHFGWLSILPPLLSIGLALVFRNVLLALFLGVWLGAWIAHGPTGAFTGLLDAFGVYVLEALANADHAAVLLFSFMIAGMVGVIMRNGGMQGIVDHIAGWTNTTKRAQLATSWLGIGIFFDDYANSLVVGNTMRPLTDRMNVSREKLAYLVDSTAAPVACIAFVTTWIGMEVGLIQAALASVGSDASAYDVFLSSLEFAFYPILAIFFVLAVAYTGRDFGPMLVAERRARATGQTLRPGAVVDEASTEEGMQPVENEPRRALNAIVPILVLLGTVLVSLWVTGKASFEASVAAGAASAADAGLRSYIGAANSYAALMWGALLGVVVAIVLSLVQRILSVQEAMDAWYKGARSIGIAMITLLLAWSLQGTTDVLGTAAFLGEQLGDALAPALLPASVFVLAAAVAFATGTSWGTMAILMPLVFPLAWTMLVAAGVENPLTDPVQLSTVACVLSGAVWGDHCSPISDTTILSSMVSGCDHMDHVRTQLPYALAVGLVALVGGTLPTAVGFPWWASLLIGAAVLAGLLVALGRHSEPGGTDAGR